MGPAISTAISNYIRGLKIFTLVTIIISIIKYNTMFILTFYFISNDGSCLNLQQSLLFIIWMIAFAFYFWDKYKIKNKFIDTNKGKSKNDIFLTYLIHIVFVKMIIACLVCILYLFLDNNIFNAIIPFLLIPKLSVLLGSSDIFGSVSKTPVFHLMETDTDADTNTDTNTDTSGNTNVPMPNIWQDINNYLLDSSYKHSEFNLEQVLSYNKAWNAGTALKQVFLQPNGLPGAREECFIWEDWNNSNEQEKFNKKKLLCDVLFSNEKVIEQYKNVSDLAKDVMEVFPVSGGTTPFIYTDINVLRIHVVSSLQAILAHHQVMNAWALSSIGVLKEHTYYNSNIIAYMFELKKSDIEQHTFLTNIFKKRNSQNISGHLVKHVLQGLADHFNKIEERTVEYEKLTNDKLKIMQHLYNTDRRTICSYVDTHTRNGHLPSYNLGKIPGWIKKIELA